MLVKLEIAKAELRIKMFTLDLQAPLSMGFSRQDYWNRLPFPTLEDLSNPGTKPMSLASPALAGRFFPTIPPGKPIKMIQPCGKQLDSF